MSEIGFSRNCFPKGNPWIESRSPWTMPARSTMDRRPLLRSGAHRSSASGRSGARELRPRGGGEEGRAGELNGGVAAAWEAVVGRLTSGRASALEDDSEGTLRAKRGSVGGVGCFTEGGVGFYRAEARRERAERLQLPG
jgi:hypothetical protein